MRFCRAGANLQGGTDIPTAVAFRQELQDLPLAAGQPSNVFVATSSPFL
jgi:hypothetical protein